jgi:hypothetical protein
MIGQRASFGRDNFLDIYYFGASEIWRDKKGGIFREWYYKLGGLLYCIDGRAIL